MSIMSLMNQVENEEIVLPAIQRDFVWSQEKVENLLDSIMRGYPTGIILLWETYNDLQYRTFVKDFQKGNRYTFQENSQTKKLKIVLDGQQRLQSLYIALYGNYEGESLYLDVLSGDESEDSIEERYLFDFATKAEAEEWNNEVISELAKPVEDRDEDFDLQYWVKVQDLFAMGGKKKQKFRIELKKKLSLSDEDELRLGTNLSIFDDAFIRDENILKFSLLDENKPSNSDERMSEADILEAFVRINRQGTPLNRSDLIFSMLKLNWKESAEAMPKFVDRINDGNSFELNTDFVIRCLFAVSNLGTKFDIDLLRKKSNTEKLKNNFKKCCDAISSTVDFVQDECWCASSKLLGGPNTLVPFVYYLYHTKGHQVPNDQITNVRKALYLFGFTHPFSRWGESRLKKFIKEELKPKADNKDETFPFKDSVWWVRYWEKIDEFGEDLLQGNPSLALHLIQNKSGAKVHYKKNSPEVDHIFPRSVLREKNIDEASINHFANFWILGKHKNQNKSNKHPKKYFEDVSNSMLKKALIDRELLKYPQYKAFLKKRSSKIIENVKRILEFTDDDFDMSEFDQE